MLSCTTHMALIYTKLGYMILPIVNGASEGLSLLSILSILSAIYGDNIWHADTISLWFWASLKNIFMIDVKIPLSNNTIIILILASTCVVTIFGQIRKVVSLFMMANRKCSSIARIVWSFMPFICLNGMTVLWSFLSVEIVRHQRDLFFLFCGSFHSRLTILLMVSHVCGVKYKPLTPSTIATFGILLLIVLIHGVLKCFDAAVDFRFDTAVLISLLMINIGGLCMLSQRTIKTFCEVLGTNCFSRRVLAKEL